eukprot:scaffold228_cov56-Cyclotella_meneghiniana.AAC.6
MDCFNAVNQTWSDGGWDFEDLSPPVFINTYWGNLIWFKWRSKKYVGLVLPDSCDTLTEEITKSCGGSSTSTAAGSITGSGHMPFLWEKE